MRDVLDRYYTPLPLARACVSVLPPNPPRIVLEPSVGGGSYARAALERWPEALLQGVDIDGDATGRDVVDHFWTGDFRDHPFKARGFDLVLGNPPYREAEDHVRAALALAPTVAFLLRLGFLAGQGRRSFWREHTPAEVHVLSRRPSFTGSGTDSSDYAWVVWNESARRGRRPSLHWLDWSPDAVAQAGAEAA